MATLLALDTSGALCSVALLHGGVEYTNTRNVVRGHNRVLLEMLDALCSDAGILPAAIEGVAYVRGPGSFTGVRLGVTAAQAIALAAGAQTFGVTTSCQLALHAESLGLDAVVTVVRSRADMCYTAAFRRHSGSLRLVQERPDVLVASAPGWLGDFSQVIGDRPGWIPEHMRFIDMDPSPGLTLLRHAAANWAGAHWASMDTVLPLYVDGDHPWQPHSA